MEFLTSQACNDLLGAVDFTNPKVYGGWTATITET